MKTQILLKINVRVHFLFIKKRVNCQLPLFHLVASVQHLHPHPLLFDRGTMAVDDLLVSK